MLKSNIVNSSIKTFKNKYLSGVKGKGLDDDDESISESKNNLFFKTSDNTKNSSLNNSSILFYEKSQSENMSEDEDFINELSIKKKSFEYENSFFSNKSENEFSFNYDPKNYKKSKTVTSPKPKKIKKRKSKCYILKIIKREFKLE